MLSMVSENGTAKIEIHSKNLAEVSGDLLIAIRALIQAIDEKDEASGQCMRAFLKDVLPEAGDPDMSFDNIDSFLSEAVKKSEKRLEEERKKKAKQIKDLIKGDDVLTGLLKAILEEDDDK